MFSSNVFNELEYSALLNQTYLSSLELKGVQGSKDP